MAGRIKATDPGPEREGAAAVRHIIVYSIQQAFVRGVFKLVLSELEASNLASR